MNTRLATFSVPSLLPFRFLYGRWIRYFSNCLSLYLVCSDSSMVDEYALQPCLRWCQNRVQIPLWSMNTRLVPKKFYPLIRSDSSMVDEYQQDSPRQLRRRRSSDSSMVDEYAEGKIDESNAKSSDSSMVDEYLLDDVKTALRVRFRFLYGRWIPVWMCWVMSLMPSSDSSMVDEYANEN